MGRPSSELLVGLSETLLQYITFVLPLLHPASLTVLQMLKDANLCLREPNLRQNTLQGQHSLTCGYSSCPPSLSTSNPGLPSFVVESLGNG